MTNNCYDSTIIIRNLSGIENRRASYSWRTRDGGTTRLGSLSFKNDHTVMYRWLRDPLRDTNDILH